MFGFFLLKDVQMRFSVPFLGYRVSFLYPNTCLTYGCYSRLMRLVLILPRRFLPNPHYSIELPRQARNISLSMHFYLTIFLDFIIFYNVFNCNHESNYLREECFSHCACYCVYGVGDVRWYTGRLPMLRSVWWCLCIVYII